MAAFTRRQYKGGAVATTTTNLLNTTDTSVTIASNTGWPTSAGVPFYVVIDPGTSAEEKCSATISGTTLTLVRAQDDTTASSHSSGAAIYPVFTANDADEANELVSKLTTKGDLLVTDGSALNRLAAGTNAYVLKADSTATNGVVWGQVTSAGLATDAVATANIQAASVSSDKLISPTVNTRTASYTLAGTDVNDRVVMNSSSATTITVNNSVFSAGAVVWLNNIGTGVCTITAGTATVTSPASLAMAQWDGGLLYFTSSSAAIYLPAGKTITQKVLTVNSVTKTDTFTTSSTSFVDVTGLSLTITPQSSTSKFLLVAQIQGGANADKVWFQFAGGNTASDVGDTAGSRIRVGMELTAAAATSTQSGVMLYLDSPATASAITYKVQMASYGGGAQYVNRSFTDTDSTSFARSASTLTIVELSA
jgi:uncharacterized protein YaiI (UPF0178 family)